jgi:hypothetical protein
MLVFFWILVGNTPVFKPGNTPVFKPGNTSVFKPGKHPIAAGLDAKNSCSNDLHRLSLAILAERKGLTAILQVTIRSPSILHLIFVFLIIKRTD